MDELLSIASVLLVILVVVTLLGHGIWVLLAKLFGAGKGRAIMERCASCGAWLPGRVGGCPTCGWGASRSPEHRRQDALKSLFQQIVALERRGLLDDATKKRLSESVIAAQSTKGERPSVPGAPVAAPTGDAVASLKPPSATEVVLIAHAVPPLPPMPERREEFSPHAPPVDVQDRVRRYMERQATHAHEDAGASAAPAPSARRPARPWSEVLAAFLEQSNIRWGELIGGLLIVCCSIALVISFWSEIAERPFLKFFVFNGVTAALFGLGFYSHRKWRLETTSQGLLIIATLLVPLNFLAIAALSARGSEASALVIAGEIFSTVAFTVLIYLAGRIVLPVAVWPLAALVALPSIATLLVGRYVNPETAIHVLRLFAGVPLLAYVAGNGILLTKYRTVEPLREAEAGHLFKLSGLSTFAVLLPLGLLLANSGRRFALLHELAPLATLLAFPALATGLLLWRQLDRCEGPWLRTAGTSVGVIGACVLVAANVLAWPEPVRMLPVTAMTAAIFLVTAIAFRIREAHLLVALATAWGVLLAAVVFVEGVEWQATAAELTAALRSRTTAMTLVALSFVSSLVGVAYLILSRRIEGWCYALVAAGTAAASLILVSWLGWRVVGDASGAVWVYAIYAATCLVAASFLNQRAAAWPGAALLLAALAQGLVFTFADQLAISYPWHTALLTHAVVCGLLAVAARAISASDASHGFRWPMQAAACATSLAAAALVVYLTPSTPALVPAVTWSIIAALWLMIGVSARWLSVFSFAQLALVLAVIFLVNSALERFEWFAEARYPWLDPWTLAAMGIGLVSLAFVWLLLRRVVLVRVRSSKTWIADLRQLSLKTRPPLDHVLANGGTVLLLAIAVYASAPGAMQELSPRGSALGVVDGAMPASSDAGKSDAEQTTPPPRAVQHIDAFAIPAISHHHAASIGSWALLASLAVLLLASLRLEYEVWKGIAVVVVLLAVPLLLSAYAEGDVAVASALRWLSTGYLLVGSAAIWARRPLMGAARAVGLAPPLEQARGSSGPLRSGVLVLSLVPLAAMLCYVALAAVLRAPLPEGAAALYGMVAVIAAMLVGFAALLRYSRLNAAAAAWSGQASTLLIVLGVAPLIAVTLYVVAAAMRQSPILGPEPDSIFGQMGTAGSYAVPIVVTALVLVGYALRERDAAFAFAGALVFCVAATAGYLLWSAKQGLPFNVTQWIRLAQLNAAVCAAYGMAWIGLRRWDRRQWAVTQPSAEPLLATLVNVGVALQAIVLLPAAIGLFLDPFPSLLLATIGSGAGWGSLVVSCVALALLRGSTRIERLDLHWVPLIVLTVGLMVAATASRWDTGDWLSFHVMLVALAASAASALAIAWFDERALTPYNADSKRIRGITRVTSALMGLTVLAALRSVFGDPQAPWWAAGTCLAMSALNAGMACWSLRRGFVVAAGLLLNLAVTLVWFEYGRPLGLESLVEINLIALTLPAPLWLLLDRYQRNARRDTIQFHGVPWHGASTWFALAVFALLVARGLAADLQAVSLPFDAWLAWGAWGAIGVGVMVCLWDADMKSGVFTLYLYGLVGAAALLDSFDLTPRWLMWAGLMILSAFGVGTSYLWSIRDKLGQLASRLRIPPAVSIGEELSWLIPCNALIAIVVVVLAFWVQLTFAEAELRVAASQAALAQAISLGLLAWGRARSPLVYASLLAGAIGAIAFGWSWLEPGTTGTVLNRAVVALAAISAVAALYALGLSKLIRRTNEWTAAGERLVPPLLGAAAAVLCFVLSFEVYDYVVTGATTISWPALITVAIVLVGLCGASIVAAVVPGRDPLGLSERGRTAYVYAAEVILALLFLHVRLTMPWLFSGYFRRYWPFIVMLLAFVGVGLAEIFRRQRRTVLAEPLEKSGAFLPLLPVLGFWFVPSEAHFSVIMVAAAGIYVVLSVMRRSFVYGVLAAAAANGGLWYLLGHAEGWGLLEHPQVWFIPPALCVLAAAYLNRAHLGEAELTTIRYASATVIYISSTADIFLVGVAEAPWLPFVLAGLSLTGIFAGILLRVRSFLMLGTGFLLLALLTVIWYAAVDLDQTWVWSVSGIVTGVLIIALFAVFEKKRQEVLGLIAQLKEWEQ